MTDIRLGIVGASATRGWARSAHLPAINAVDGIRVTAVSTRSIDTSELAAEIFGAAHAFDNAKELANCSDVDLVLIAVKVTDHLEAVKQAVAAGKAVYCEWPLASSLEDSRSLRDLAKNARIKNFIGLQSRSAPTFRYLKDLVDGGFVGNVLSSSVIASGMQWGPQEQPVLRYLNERRSGGTMTTIPMGHFLDVHSWILSDFDKLSVAETTHIPNPVCSETGEVMQRDVADDIVVSGVLKSGTLVSVHYRLQKTRGYNFIWEIKGELGDLRVVAPSGHAQIATLELFGARGEELELSALSVPDKYKIPDAANAQGYNLTHVYRSLVQHWNGEQQLPDFDEAIKNHELLERIDKLGLAFRQ